MIKRLLTRVFAPWYRRVAEDERFVRELQTAVRQDPNAYVVFLAYLKEGDR